MAYWIPMEMLASPDNPSLSPEEIARLPLPPGSSGLPLLGETLAFMRDTSGFLKERRHLHGDVFRSHVLGEPIAFLLGPEANRWIFAGENKYLRNRWHIAARKLLGEQSVAMLKGADHLTRRRLLAPHFTYNAMRAFAPRIEALTRRHCEQWTARTEPFKAVDAVRALVFEVAISLILGDGEAVDAAYMSRLFRQWAAGLFAAVPLDLPFTPFRRAIAAGREMHAYLESLVVEREKLAEQPPDVLGALLSTRDEEGQPLPREAIIQEIELQLFAGHDTTVTATSNLLLLLAQHPKVMERCRQEQRGLEGPLTLETLRAMPYLHQVIQETMRFITPIGGSFRVTTQDVAYGGYRIPQGWQVALCILGTHQGPPWTTPERFDPERMGPERCEQKPPGAYIPFGGGPRVCLGQHFAMVEMAAVAALLLRDYQWELIPGQDLSLYSFPIPLPRSGLLVRFSRR